MVGPEFPDVIRLGLVNADPVVVVDGISITTKVLVRLPLFEVVVYVVVDNPVHDSVVVDSDVMVGSSLVDVNVSCEPLELIELEEVELA